MDGRRYELVMSALLHDIGKFIQRGEGMYSKRHEEYSREFIMNNLPSLTEEQRTIIADLAGAHHSDVYPGVEKELLEILKKSDTLSAAHDRMKYEMVEEHVVNSIPLKSVISEIFKGELKGSVPDLSHPLVGVSTKLKDMQARGKKEIVGSLDYRRLYRGFKEDLKKMRGKEGKSLADTLNYLLMKWTRFVPSAVYLDVPDIPLYDHLKTTAAIALCLYEGDREKPFLFVTGDVSGIQNFIFYNYSAENVDEHATKRMRGRSLLVNLLVDAAAKHILESLSLYEFNLLWSSGGHFIILAPNTEENLRKIDDIRREVNLYLKENFERLALVISVHESDEEGIRDFPKTLEKIHIALEEEKARKHAAIWEEIDIQIDVESGKEICPSCGRIKDLNKDRCDVCMGLEQLGGIITGGKRIVRRYNEWEVGEGGWRFVFGNIPITYSVIREGELNSEEEGDIFILNSTEFVVEGHQSNGFRLWGTYVPRGGSGILSLNEMLKVENGERSDVTAPLAVFKADVDFLGFIFSEGLKGAKESISRITFLSFLFDLFFSVGVSGIAEENKIYVVFSGGDDLTVAGRFDHVFKFGMEVNKRFLEWMGGHPYIHLSGGFALSHPKFPLRKLVEYAEEALEKSKERGAEEFFKRKNAVTAFGTTVPWYVMDKQIVLSEKLHEKYKKKEIGAGIGHFLLSLKRYSIEEGARPEKGKPLLFRDPLLRYYLVRNWKGKGDDMEDFVRTIEDNWEGADIGTQYWILCRRFKVKEVKSDEK